MIFFLIYKRRFKSKVTLHCGTKCKSKWTKSLKKSSQIARKPLCMYEGCSMSEFPHHITHDEKNMKYLLIPMLKRGSSSNFVLMWTWVTWTWNYPSCFVRFRSTCGYTFFHRTRRVAQRHLWADLAASDFHIFPNLHIYMDGKNFWATKRWNQGSTRSS